MKIYTCGKMYGRTYDECMEWRNKLEQHVNLRLTNKNVEFVHPPNYYNYEFKGDETEKEVMEFELNKLMECDVVVAELNHMALSPGSCVELGAVWCMNNYGHKHIFVVGYDNRDPENTGSLSVKFEGGNEISISQDHPWINENMIKVSNDLMDIADFIVDYLLGGDE